MTRLERREQALHWLILLNKDKTEYHTERSGHKNTRCVLYRVCLFVVIRWQRIFHFWMNLKTQPQQLVVNKNS